MKAQKMVCRIAAVALLAGAMGALAVPTASAGTLPYGADRIGVLKNGQLLVKQGGLDANWAVEADNVAKFEISGNRIGILRTDGTVAVKEGGLDANWVEENDHVTDLRLTESRIGVLRSGGTLLVKEGGLDADWVQELDGVTQFALAGNRIGTLRTDGTASVKEGPLDANWMAEDSNVTALELGGDRVGVLHADRTASVKEGALDADWVQELDNVTQIALFGDRIGALRADGSVLVKEGGLSTDWVAENDGVSTVRLAAAPRASSHESQVTLADIVAIYGSGYGTQTVADGLDSLNAEMVAAGITTPARKAAFLATLKHESGFRYNAGEAGNSSSYRGRGFIQITGVGNYQSAGAYLGHDFAGAPDDAATARWSAAIARWYWTVARNINPSADNLDMGAVDKAIGYSSSLDPAESQARCDDFKKALLYYNGSLPGGINCVRH